MFEKITKKGKVPLYKFKSGLCKEDNVLVFSNKPELKESELEYIARTCYNSYDKMDYSSTGSFIKKLVDMGHESVIEHTKITFYLKNVSRVLTHQLVRHRIASYTQESQRYVKTKSINDFAIPDSILNNKEALVFYNMCLEDILTKYRILSERYGIPIEDARYLLPNATPSNIVVTMNLRELRHFFKLRVNNKAQKEIKEVALQMQCICKNLYPSVFAETENKEE